MESTTKSGKSNKKSLQKSKTAQLSNAGIMYRKMQEKPKVKILDLKAILK